MEVQGRRNIQEEILKTLREIEEKEKIHILLAVESGSRAWGFASPDSDYDVRFIYVRRPEDYLRLDALRDVIEWQLDQVLDINGWDLKKALIHFQKGNAVLFEWALSPVVYRSDPMWNEIYRTARGYFSEKTAVYHYYGTANSTFRQYLTGEAVRYKKYFYALRPLLAARFVEAFHSPAPVLFKELMERETGLEEALRQEIERVQRIKMASDEKQMNPQSPAIRDFIVSELARQKKLAQQLPDDRNRDWGPLNERFYGTLREAWGKDG